jgi:hypothetical protein
MSSHMIKRRKTYKIEYVLHNTLTMVYLPPYSVVRDNCCLVVGVIEYPVTRSADIVIGSGPRDALPQCAVPRREMVNVTVVQRVPGVVFGQP